MKLQVVQENHDGSKGERQTKEEAENLTGDEVSHMSPWIANDYQLILFYTISYPRLIFFPESLVWRVTRLKIV